MEITVTQKDGIHIAQLSGVLEERDRQLVEEQLHSIITERGSRTILDLSGVPRLTSMGLGLLVTLVARANTKGGADCLGRAGPICRLGFPSHSTRSLLRRGANG